MRERRVSSLFRWLWVLALAVIGAACFESLLASVWTFTRQWSIPDRIPIWTVWILVFSVTVALLWTVIEPLRIGPKQLKYVVRYPPIWLAVALAFALVAIRRLFDPDLLRPALALSIPVWVVVFVIVMILIPVIAGALRLRDRHGAGTSANLQLDEAPEDWKYLEEWARVETPSAVDLFDHKPIAGRLARILGQPGAIDQSVALVGEYGSGKSTILRWVQADLLKTRNPAVQIVWVSCWGFSDSASVAIHVMERLIETLQQAVDLSAIRGLPQAYRRMMAPEKLRWVERLFGTDRDSDVLRRLEQLPELLEILDLRVVLFVEDADRAAATGFEPGRLERLLWILKDLRHVTFVLALSRESTLDISKLCDHVEVLPPLNGDTVARALARLREHWQRDYKYITPKTRQRSDPLELESEASKGLAAYLRASGGRPLRSFRNFLGRLDA
jgi:hypothetical protein